MKIRSLLILSILGMFFLGIQTAKTAQSLSGLVKKTATPSSEQNVFAGSVEVDELVKLEPIVEDLQVSLDAHNLMYNLKSYQNVQKQYNNMKKLHDRSVELLRNSEQCLLNHLGKYVNNPEVLWSGKDMTAHPENHDERTGLSAWAIEMFETAKAAEVSPISTDDVVTIDTTETKVYDDYGNEIGVETEVSSETETIDTNIQAQEDAFDLEKVNASGAQQAEQLNKNSGGNYFKEPSKQEDMEKAARESELLSVDIGSEVAEWIAKYLLGEAASDGPAWNSQNLGAIKKPYPIWNDQKIFFNQYLIRKYSNIYEFIKAYKIPENINEKITQIVLDNQKQYMNEAEKQLTSASVAAKQTAQKLYEEKVEKLKKENSEKFLLYRTQKEAEIAQLKSEAEKKKQTINTKINNVNKQRDELMSQIDEITQENVKLKQSITELNSSLTELKNLLNNKDISEEEKKTLAAKQKEINTEIVKTQNSILQSETKKSELQKIYDDKTNEYNSLKEDIAKIESKLQKDIGEINNLIAEEKQRIQEAEKKKIEEYTEELRIKNENIDKAEIAAKAAIGSNSLITAQNIISQSNLAVEDARDIALKNIEKLMEAYKALGDDLYLNSSQAIIDSYHQGFMSSLKGQEAQVGSVKLDSTAAKIHAISNYNIDIVINEIMDESMKELYLTNYRNLVKNTTLLMQVSVFEELVKSLNTGIDSQFYVGLEANEKDFSSPKVVPVYPLPPLREYIRLDYIDLQNIGKDGEKMYVGEYKKISEIGVNGIPFEQTVWQQTVSIPISLVDKEKFLTYGGKIPEIWKMMLKDKAFVDSDFYLSSKLNPNSATTDKLAGILGGTINPFNLGGEEAALFRGGIYPCVLKSIKNSNDITCSVGDKISNGTGYIDVYEKDIKNNEYRFVIDFVTGESKQNLSAMNLPTCQEVSASCTTNVGSSKKAYVVFPKEKENGPESNNHKNSFGYEEYSELGTILNIYSGKMVNGGKYVENVIGFSPYMQSIANYGTRMEEKSSDTQSEDLSKEESINDDVYVKAQYKINQVGDFLDHVEIEQDYQKALDDLEEKVKESRTEMEENFAKFGIEVTPEFDITNQEDYDFAYDKLKKIKESYAKKAETKVQEINVGSSQMLKDYKNSFSRTYTAIMLDDTAVMKLSMDVSDMAEFQEDLKTARANNNVDETYESTGDENFEETLRSLTPAYCATY